jgi:enoyl-CoA hydratase
MDKNYILYEHPAANIARIVLNRVETRNSQDTDFLYQLNDAFDRAAQDDEAKVIVLASNGPHFSSGHDLREQNHAKNRDQYRVVSTASGYHRPGAEGRIAREEEVYFQFSERWRNLPKPTIAAVQGRCIAGGLMLVWPCDLIVAAEDATFEDITVAMGIGGVEYFAHPWELGNRLAKEMLFTGRPVTAQEAHRCGMVNRVVPSHDLQAETLSLASLIARQSSFALQMTKRAVNAAEDAQGRRQAMETAFALHQLAHSHCMEVYGVPIDPNGTFGKGAKKTTSERAP